MTDIETLIKNEDYEKLVKLILDGFLQLDDDLRKKEQINSRSK